MSSNIFDGMPDFGDLPPAPGSDPLAPPSGRGRKSRAPKARSTSSSKAPKAPKSKLSARNKVFALIFAGVAALLAYGTVAAPANTVFVLRSTESISAYSVAVADQFEVAELSAASIEPGAVQGASAEDLQAAVDNTFAGARARFNVPAGRQIHASDFSIPTDTVILEANERLVSIEAQISAAVGGGIQPGDRVDVIAVGRIAGDSFGNVIVTNVEVVSVLASENLFDSAAQSQISGSADKTPDQILPDSPVPGMYVVRVTVEEAVKLSVAGGEATLYLALRGIGGVDVETIPASLADLIMGSQDDLGLAPGADFTGDGPIIVSP